MKKNLKKILVGLVVVIVLAVIFLRGDQLGKLFPSRAPFPRKPLVTCKIAFRV